MSKNILKVGVVLSAAILALTACQAPAETPSKTPTETPPATSTAATPTAAATPSAVNSADPARADADLVIWSDADRAPVVQKFADQFAADNGLKAQVQIAADARAMFATATQVGKGPDIVVGAHDWLGEFVQNNLVAPVQLSEADQAKFSEAALSAVKFNGQIYGVPYAVENIALVRNKDLVPEAPATMDDLVKAAKELQSAGKVQTLLVQEVGKSGNAYFTYPYLSAFGGGIFGLNDKGDYDPSKIIVNSPESIKGAEVLKQLGAQKVLSTNIDGSNSDAIFGDKKAAFFITGPWAIQKAKDAGVNYAISNLPSLTGGGPMQPFLGVQMFYMSSKAKNAAIAQEFLTQYVTTKDFQVELFEVGHRPPALIEAYDEVAAQDPDVKAWFEAGKDAMPMPNIPAMAAVWGPLGQAGADVISGKAEPKVRFDQAAAEIKAAIG